MTDEEEIFDDDSEGIPIEPKRMVFADFLVLFANLTYHVLEALVLSANELAMTFAAHANYRKQALEEKKAVEKFRKQLDGLPK